MIYNMIRIHKNIFGKIAIGLAAMLYAMPTMAQGTLKISTRAGDSMQATCRMQLP